MNSLSKKFSDSEVLSPANSKLAASLEPKSAENDEKLSNESVKVNSEAVSDYQSNE